MIVAVVLVESGPHGRGCLFLGGLLTLQQAAARCRACLESCCSGFYYFFSRLTPDFYKHSVVFDQKVSSFITNCIAF